MNRPGIIWIAITLMPSTLSLTYAQSDNGFEELYRKADEKVRAYLYKDQYGEVEPVWKDTHTFCYQTSGRDSTESYKVDLKTLTKTQVSRDTRESYRTPERQRGAWGGFGGGYAGGFGGFPGRTDTGTKSPDGLWECLIRDHNIWVRNAESGELTQLSFDGNEQDSYTPVT